VRFPSECRGTPDDVDHPGDGHAQRARLVSGRALVS
jgi:hypothetical protein